MRYNFLCTVRTFLLQMLSHKRFAPFMQTVPCCFVATVSACFLKCNAGAACNVNNRVVLFNGKPQLRADVILPQKNLWGLQIPLRIQKLPWKTNRQQCQQSPLHGVRRQAHFPLQNMHGTGNHQMRNISQQLFYYGKLRFQLVKISRFDVCLRFRKTQIQLVHIHVR